MMHLTPSLPVPLWVDLGRLVTMLPVPANLQATRMPWALPAASWEGLCGTCRHASRRCRNLPRLQAWLDSRGCV